MIPLCGSVVWNDEVTSMKNQNNDDAMIFNASYINEINDIMIQGILGVPLESSNYALSNNKNRNFLMFLTAPHLSYKISKIPV